MTRQDLTIVTTTARRIARRLNYLGAGFGGGFCVFAADGTGGYFYTGNSRPTLGAGETRFWVPSCRVTAREIQAMLAGITLR